MEKYRRRLAVIIFVALVVSVLVVWMGFQPAALHFVAQKKALIVLGVCVMFIPVGFYPAIAKRVPRLAIGLSLLAVGAIAAAYAAIAGLIFDVQNGWVEGTLNLSFVFWAMAALAFIWQGVRGSKRRQEREINRSPK